jgi:hypothetical protein
MSESYRLMHADSHNLVLDTLPSFQKLVPQQFVKGPFFADRTGKGVRICIIGTGIVEHNAAKIESSLANLGRSKHSRDENGHSFAVAGLIAASDPHKLMGIAPLATIECAKATDNHAIATTDSITASILWGAATAADIIVISHSIDFEDEPIAMALEKASECHAIVVVEEGLCVAPDHVIDASSLSLKLPPDIFTLAPDEKYAMVSTESFRPAIVAALVALLMEQGHMLPEGKQRIEVVKPHLLSLLA